MLTVRNLAADGRHAPLVRPTSFTVARGELILVQAPSQLARTGLSLILTGRMQPDGGEMTWDGEPSRRALRSASELFDSPAVNEMETHMRVRDYVAEMLSYQPHRFLQRPRAGEWLAAHDLGDLDDLWDEQLTGEQRIRLHVALARSHRGADLLVFDTPSRHANHSATWIPRLEELAQDPDHPRAVVAVVPHISEKWNGPIAVAGEVDEEPAVEPAHGGPVEDLPADDPPADDPLDEDPPADHPEPEHQPRHSPFAADPDEPDRAETEPDEPDPTEPDADRPDDEPVDPDHTDHPNHEDPR